MKSEKSVDSADGYNRPGNSADEYPYFVLTISRFVLDDNDLQELCNEIGTIFDKKIEEEELLYVFLFIIAILMRRRNFPKKMRNTCLIQTPLSSFSLSNRL